MKLRAIRVSALLTLVLGLATSTVAAQNYLNDLGAVAPGLGINNSGQVVLQNYFYSSGTLTAFPANFTGAGINASGQVVGAQTPPPEGACPGPGTTYPVSPCIAVWASGTVTAYPGFLGFPDYVGNFGLSINSSGQIVGNWHATEVHDYTGGLLFSNSVFSNLGFTYPPGGACTMLNPASTFGAPNYAYAINDAGQIAGEGTRWNVDQTGQCNEAYFYSQGTYTDIGPGAALALNATGHVVGVLFSQPTVAHAFLYNPSGSGAAQDLGTLPGGTSSYAYAINAPGLIVGASSTATLGYPLDPGQLDYPVLSYEPANSSGTSTAFFYDGVMMDLNTFVSANDPLKPFVTLTDARGINDSGLIIVNGVDSRTQASHAYLLQAPSIQVAPGPLTFPSEPIGSQSPPQTATFTNVGSASIALGTASVSANFVIETNGCGNSLGAAAQCAITVVFAPTGAGSPSGTLTLLAGGVPIAVPLLSPLSVSISASATTATTASGVTLRWTAAAGAACTATGGDAADGWTGSVPTSGSRSVKEAAPGTYTYGISCTAGPQTQTAQAAAVTVSWAPVTVTLTAAPTTLYTGQSTTLTWSAANASTCMSSGGGSNDSWPNSSRPTSGSATITEPNPVITGGSETLTFTLTCTSSASSLSGSDSVSVVQLDTPPPSSGGGGALDPLLLVFLLSLLAAPKTQRELRLLRCIVYRANP
jgi:hypothetical protein